VTFCGMRGFLTVVQVSREMNYHTRLLSEAIRGELRDIDTETLFQLSIYKTHGIYATA